MSLTQIFETAGSGMNAQSLRLNTTASNIANAEAAHSSTDQVYRGRHPVFSTYYNSALQGREAVGVKVQGIVESQAPLQQRYEPHHPKADEDGYVFYPNVNVVEEMTNMLGAGQ